MPQMYILLTENLPCLSCVRRKQQIKERPADVYLAHVYKFPSSDPIFAKLCTMQTNQVYIFMDFKKKRKTFQFNFKISSFVSLLCPLPA